MMYQVLVHALGVHWGRHDHCLYGGLSRGETSVKKIHMMTIMQKKRASKNGGQISRVRAQGSREVSTPTSYMIP